MNLQDFVKSTGSPAPAYVLVAKQAYLRDKVYEHCQLQVDEAARAFDWAVFDLAKDDVKDALACARTMPWMSPRRWVYVRNAEQADEELAAYLKDPSQRTVLVLETSKKVRAWGKTPSIEMEEGDRVVDWVRQRCREEGFALQNGAAEMLVELVGDDLQRLESELEKIILSALDSKKISVDAVLNLTVEARERDVFELIGALAEQRREEALVVLNRLCDDGVSPIQIASMVYWSFIRLLVAKERLSKGDSLFELLKSLKIWSYKGKERQIRSYSRDFLVEVLLKLREIDRISKSSSSDTKLSLERVIIDTCRR